MATSKSFTCKCSNNFTGKYCDQKYLNSTLFINSTILTQENSIRLLNLLNLSSNASIEMLYQASKHGFCLENFITNSNRKLKKFVLIKSKNSFIFGVYTTVDWPRYDETRTDTDSFIFSLVNSLNAPLILKVINATNLIRYGLDGFSFGEDLEIADQSNKNMNSYGNIGKKYQLPSNLSYGSHEWETFIAGSLNFQIEEIETYFIQTI